MEREYNVGTWLTPSDEYIKDIKQTLVEKGIVDEKTPDSEISKVIQQTDFTDYMELRITGQPYEYSNSNITEITEGAFYWDHQLNGIELPNVVKIGANAFNQTGRLKKVNLPNVETIGDNAFNGSFTKNNLELLNLPNLKTLNRTSDSTFMTNYDGSNETIGLLNVSVPKVEKFSYRTFYQCRALKSAYIGNCTSLGSSIFSVCKCLVAIIITQSNSVATFSGSSVLDGCCHFNGTVDSKCNPTGAKDGYVYVPDSLVDSYKTATNWSTISTQIKGLSELPQEYKDLYGI